MHSLGMEPIVVAYSCFILYLRDECARLRLELSERHGQDSRAGLAELASLKDAAMREAREEWERERRRLEEKVHTHTS